MPVHRDADLFCGGFVVLVMSSSLTARNKFVRSAMYQKIENLAVMMLHLSQFHFGRPA